MLTFSNAFEDIGSVRNPYPKERYDYHIWQKGFGNLDDDQIMLIRYPKRVEEIRIRKSGQRTSQTFLDVLTGCFFLSIYVYIRYNIYQFLLTSYPGQFSIHSIEAGRFSSTEFFTPALPARTLSTLIN
jgi:hypothetical protein